MSAHEAFAALREAGLEPLLAAARRKVYEEDGVRGRVRLVLGPAQREELANLLGRVSVRGGQVQVVLQELDAALVRSRFRTGLLEVLEAGYGPIVTRRQEREAAEASWAGWLKAVGDRLPPAGAVRAWFKRLTAGESPSARWVRRAYRSDPELAARTVAAVGAALADLPADRSEHELLAVFAARLTGDPHAFDAKEPAGALLEHALRERFRPPPEGLRPGAARAFLLDQAGLGVDQVSSTVLVAHLAEACRADGTPHPMVAAMTACSGAWAVTLGELRRWSAARAHGGQAFVVENPPVFEWLLQRLAQAPPEHRATLICTGGFLSAAGLRLLDLLVADGTEIWYGGDFDRNGIVIAAGLAARYGDRFRLWRFGPEDYQAAAEGAMGPPLSDADREALLAVEGPLAATARAVVRGGVAAYQERLVEVLVQDLLG
ncbi:MAG: TIGR02679 family protein [Bacillota bacterium]|nr:MAG: TIGR02679 family protein [Bacillota bacterium]